MDRTTILPVVIILIVAFALYFLFGKNDSTLSDSDAKRFAKLLVSEIKLYENYKIERGLRNNNLYESLRDEIEEARKKYKKRIPESKFEKCFNDALVEILANGDNNKLGNG